MNAGWASAGLAAVPPGVRAVLEALAGAGVEAVVVGGCVRDLARGAAPNDWDVAADAPPERLLELFPGAIPTGVAHGTVTVMGDVGGARQEGIEITSYRGDGPYLDGRHPSSVRFGVPLQDDLARRDFTVNAVAWVPARGAAGVVDPFGGLADLDAGVLRAVGDPAVRFAEDGLRTMRAARLAATLGLRLDDATRLALRGARGVLARVAWERRRDELEKLLGAPQPSVGLRLLEESDLIEEIIPELREGVGCLQNRWHALDVWDHTLAVVDAAPPRPLVRWAALLHDVAKPRCRALHPDTGEVTFYNHEVVGEAMAAAALDRLHAAAALRDEVAALVRHHLVRYEPSFSDAAVRRFVARVGRARLPDLFDLAHADNEGKGRPEAAQAGHALLDELAARIAALDRPGAATTVAELALRGDEVMRLLGVGPGPHVGEALRAMLEAVLDDPARNTPGALAALLADWWRRRAAT
ncbi:MAG TPA: HD domain-containing protein [Myxococcota bacterium]|nr:HD domain-containing protein [Myxococcota bacterium]